LNERLKVRKDLVSIMKKLITIYILCISVLFAVAGCTTQNSGRSNSNEAFEASPSGDIYGAPEKAPGLNVCILQDNIIVQCTVAVQLTTSWSLNFEDGTGTGYESDSPHALQIGAGYYNASTLRLTDSHGIIEMQFSDDYPPQSISVERWKADYAAGSQDINELINRGEPVEVSGYKFNVIDDENDYIYSIYARWPENGTSRYAFRLESDS